MGSSSGKSLPQLLGDEGHEGGEQGQGRGHTVIQDAGGHLCVREDQRRLHMLLNTDTEPASARPHVSGFPQPPRAHSYVFPTD